LVDDRNEQDQWTPITRRRFLMAASASVGTLTVAACGGGIDSESVEATSDGTATTPRVSDHGRSTTPAPAPARTCTGTSTNLHRHQHPNLHRHRTRTCTGTSTRTCTGTMRTCTAPACTAPAPAPAPAPSWVVDPVPVLISGSPTSIFDLKKTLPTTAMPGGTFKIDPSGVPLPAGVTLTADGLLSANGASTGSTSGIVFSYVEPI
jgi:hypothetical protein